MPLYEYECDACGHRFEIIQKFSDEPVEKCPVCGGRVHKLQSAPAFHLKGSGWYITDYAKKDQAGAKEEGGSTETKDAKDTKESKDAESKDAKSKDAKPAAAAKTETKTDKAETKTDKPAKTTKNPGADT
jgi:putative FmdB family regulatory protein